jgi:hypothetical protein
VGSIPSTEEREIKKDQDMHTHTHRKDHAKTKEEDSHLQAKEIGIRRKTTLLTP